MLDGLFHQLVVLREADQDCRFYAAALDAADQVQALPIPPADVLFLPSNGKAGMARLATAPRSVGVRVVASPDLDVLSESASMTRLVGVLGGDWPAMQADFGQAVAPIRAPRAPTTAAGVKAAVNSVLGDALAENPAAPYTRELANRVRDALRSTDSPWQEVKRYGSQAFRGHSAQALVRLLDHLAGCGVVPVRVGELERFAPELAVSKGKEWLPAALAAGAHYHTTVQQHVSRLLDAGGFAHSAGSRS